jgi:antitoxin HigA-1
VTRIQAIVAELMEITGDTALRLARYFDTTPEFWMNLQRDFELKPARWPYWRDSRSSDSGY